MQIVCPSCNARYLAPDANIGPNGRRVRCARCAHVWRVTLPEAVETDPAVAATDSEPAAEAPPENSGLRVNPLPPNRLPAPLDAHKRRSSGGLGWAFFAMVVGALAAALYFGRATMVEVWPAATVLYEAVGLGDDAAEPRAAFEVKRIEHAWDGDAMVISGEVENASDVGAPPQYIRIKLLDAEGGVVSDQRQPLGEGAIGPNEIRAFTMRFDKPGEVVRALPLVEPIR